MEINAGQDELDPTADPSAYARGFRLSSELVAGVLVGAGPAHAMPEAR